VADEDEGGDLDGAARQSFRSSGMAPVRRPEGDPVPLYGEFDRALYSRLFFGISEK
jgi:hypothetical protein